MQEAKLMYVIIERYGFTRELVSIIGPFETEEEAEKHKIVLRKRMEPEAHNWKYIVRALYSPKD